MTTAASKFPDTATATSSPAVAPPVVTWLRIEGLSVAALSAVVYARSGASWWLFAGLWLVPDLSFLAYRAGPRWGSYAYNAVHSYLTPVVLGLIGVLAGQGHLLPYALIWCNHIGVDRMLGYGLKYPTSFGATHLKSPRA